ncbi:MAG: S-adenosylmethionine synthetase N-terminal domain-containing protein [Acetobacteraceae bacterium]|nr:S-adenosylmethionine synthetase N-terminal domain-containing protein [Acetobacteraceae bacterium]
MRDGTILISESVTPGHPDKLCDRISDAAIDAFLRQDARARAVVECAVATGIVFIAARFAAEAVVDLPGLARRVIAEAGYVGEGFDARTCSILTAVSELPPADRGPAPGGARRRGRDRGLGGDGAGERLWLCDRRDARR